LSGETIPEGGSALRKEGEFSRLLGGGEESWNLPKEEREFAAAKSALAKRKRRHAPSVKPKKRREVYRLCKSGKEDRPSLGGSCIILREGGGGK